MDTFPLWFQTSSDWSRCSQECYWSFRSSHSKIMALTEMITKILIGRYDSGLNELHGQAKPVIKKTINCKLSLLTRVWPSRKCKGVSRVFDINNLKVFRRLHEICRVLKLYGTLCGFFICPLNKTWNVSNFIYPGTETSLLCKKIVHPVWQNA